MSLIRVIDFPNGTSLTIAQQISLNRSVKSLRTALMVLKAKPLWILPMGLVYALIDQTLTERMTSLLTSTEGISPLVWVFGFLSVMNNLLFPLLLLFVTLAAIQNRPTLAFFQTSFSYAVREQLRATGRVISWGLIFLLPGFYKYFRLIFVPFVVAQNPQYMQGTVDALKSSQGLTAGGNFWKVVGLCLVFAGLFPILLSSFDDYRLLLETPLTAIPLVCVETFLSVFFVCCLFHLFLKASGLSPLKNLESV